MSIVKGLAPESFEIHRQDGDYIDSQGGMWWPCGDNSYLNKLGHEIWDTCEEKGFHEPVDPKILERSLRLLLIVSELGEALEAIRRGDEANHREEIADTVIRLLHYGAHENIDLDAEVDKKMAINRGRPFKHGKKF